MQSSHRQSGDDLMPRYLIERDFPDGLRIPVNETGAKDCLAIVDSNLSDQVTWVHSYVSADKKRTFCIYDAPTPEAIRLSAARNKLPITAITEVRVLDPYFYK
jgi:Nickel responsive protein SCO4226-like